MRIFLTGVSCVGKTTIGKKIALIQEIDRADLAVLFIEELKLLARGVFVLDTQGQVVHAETVGEVTNEPNYEAALAALKGQL